MITEISIENMKGQTVTQSFSGKNIIIGKNGSGKTTRIQALGLAMLGSIPGQGATSQSTFKFATGDKMSVSMKTSKFGFSRTFAREEKLNKKTGERTISIKETLSVSPSQGERTATEKKERILQEIGNFPVALDFNKFLDLSDAKRREFIYSLSPIESNSWNKSKLAAYLKEKMLTDALYENNKEQYQITETVIEESLQEYPDHLDIQGGLLSMLDWTAEEMKHWKRRQADSQGAVRQMSEVKNELLETDRNIAETKKELDALQQNLIQIESKIAGDIEKKRAIDNRLQRIEEIKVEIQKVNEVKLDDDTLEIDKKIAALTADMPLPLNLQNELQPMNDKIEKINQQIAEHQPGVNSIREQVMNIKANVQTLDSTLRQVGEMTGFCVISPMISCPKDFTGFDKYVEEKKQQAHVALGELENRHEEAMEVLKGYQSEISNLENLKARAFSDAQTVQEKREAATEKIKELEGKRQRVLSLVDRRNNKLDALQEELEKMMNQKNEPIGDIELMQKQSTGTKVRIEELKTQVEEKEKSKQTLILMNENVLQNSEAEYKAAALKQLQDHLGAKGAQGELVKEILEPIRLQIEENLKLMKFEQKPFFQTESETGKELFEFGWVDEKGHAVNFDALSTGQQTVFLAAMMMVIIDKAQPKLRVLVMDNLNHLDKENFQLLINGLDGLAHKVDNIILAGALEYSFGADGWQVDDLSGEVVANAEHIA